MSPSSGSLFTTTVNLDTISADAMEDSDMDAEAIIQQSKKYLMK